MSKGILETQPTKSRLGLGKVSPKAKVGSTKESTLHNTSSINNIPEILKSKSGLDLNGATPSKYLDNPPV